MRSLSIVAHSLASMLSLSTDSATACPCLLVGMCVLQGAALSAAQDRLEAQRQDLLAARLELDR